ncbi:hypothetical protein N7495_009592 [Penicillium taxi]|uniref:uncharacterized protein n=1 Tax=Penicillium taxi TaxID=168475 RepID=UPI0025451EA5|nr:uncharacterized protein N7495_009592 [Penicillium taxi]KAJ5885082.1 hypothetical protein N7495_009592 [Penicillium taxi]
MESPRLDPSNLDEDKYREEVLQLESAEAEEERAQKLADEARELGLKVPQIEASAALAASIASGLVDISSPVLSSGSSTDQNSITDGSVTTSLDPASSPFDQIAISVSDTTIASERAKSGSPRSSPRSLASLFSRPTSYCASESRNLMSGYANNDEWTKSNRLSTVSVDTAEKKMKRHHSLKNAIVGRIHFRKKRAPSAAMLPPNARITVSRGEGGVNHIFLEGKRECSTSHEMYTPRTSNAESLSKLEVPIYDKESLQRSLDDPELSEMQERHRLERDRHMAFQNAALDILRNRHQTVVSERQKENHRLEDEKREHNSACAIRIEERQLAVEMEQQTEFERSKVNSRTRIKHMEGYFRSASPTPKPSETTSEPAGSISPSKSDNTPARRFTRQQREQLEQQYHDYDTMDALHDARVKVLRDRQEMKLKEAVARMQRELEEMCTKHVQSINALQGEHRHEESTLIQALFTKKCLLRHRWNLEEAILRRQLEVRHDQIYGPLPPLSFSVIDTEI